jgi:apolipoprotein N-acyltransferase
MINMKHEVRSHGFAALGPVHEAFARLQGWRAVGVAVLLGAFSAVAFAPFHFSPVLILSFTCLVWMIDGARGVKRWGRAVFLRGWAFGVGYFLVGMHWTAAPFLVDPARHLIFIWMPLVLLPAGMALIWGSFAAMAGAFWSSSPSRIFVFALFFALAEFTRGHLFGGFPWNLAGTTWVPGGALSQAAALGGVYWLTLLTVFCVSAPAALVDTREARGLGLRLVPTFVAVVLVAVGWAWGAQRIAGPALMSDRPLVLMDAGVPEREVDAAGPAAILDQYLQMLAADKAVPGEIVIWPEGAVPAYLLQDPFAMDMVVAALGERTLMIGTARFERHDSGAELYYNSLALLDDTASRTGPISIYDKHRLVPFGELAATRIVPFGTSISALLPPAMQRMASDGFSPGPGPAVIDYPGIAPPFVAMICYEGLFPEVARKANLGARADWMVQISNDGWFGPSMGPAQHYAQNRYRAIENGLPLVRVASRGTSAILDPFGREIARATSIETETSSWDTRILKGALPFPGKPTLYQTRSGVALYWLTLTVFVLLSFASWRR